MMKGPHPAGAHWHSTPSLGRSRLDTERSSALACLRINIIQRKLGKQQGLIFSTSKIFILKITIIHFIIINELSDGNLMADLNKRDEYF